jgi:rubrerythrin
MSIYFDTDTDTEADFYTDLDPFYPINLAMVDEYVKMAENDPENEIYHALLRSAIIEAQAMADTMYRLIIANNDGLGFVCGTCGGVVTFADFCAFRGMIMASTGEPVSCPLCGDFM